MNLITRISIHQIERNIFSSISSSENQNTILSALQQVNMQIYNGKTKQIQCNVWKT